MRMSSILGATCTTVWGCTKVCHLGGGAQGLGGGAQGLGGGAQGLGGGAQGLGGGAQGLGATLSDYVEAPRACASCFVPPAPPTFGGPCCAVADGWLLPGPGFGGAVAVQWLLLLPLMLVPAPFLFRRRRLQRRLLRLAVLVFLWPDQPTPCGLLCLSLIHI